MLTSLLSTRLTRPATHRFLNSPRRTMTFDSSARLAALREQMKKHELAVYIVDSGDAHSNEYTAEADDRRVRPTVLFRPAQLQLTFVYCRRPGFRASPALQEQPSS